MFQKLVLATLALFGATSVGGSDWHMIIGGSKNLFEQLSTVELYNWKTGQQCQLEDIPAAVHAHSGTNIDGVPVFCGGLVDDVEVTDCYKYADGKWEPIASLSYPISWAADTYVPNRGWVIFGGSFANVSTAQQLASLDGSWEDGPELFPAGAHDRAQCAVQISDTLTGFVGGELNNHSAVTYDWETGSYTEHPATFTGERIRSSCAIMNAEDGEKVVGVVGSDSANSKGMEVWNLKEGAIRTLAEALPHEDSNLGLDGSQMLTVDDGASLILYGGFAGEYLADILQYNVAEDNWVLIGNMTTSRYGHVVIPVDTITCPEVRE